MAEIPFLKQQGYYNTAVNRLYYACYYAAVAILIQHGINPGTHSGVKQMIGMHFVATGRLPKELGRYSLYFLKEDIVAIMMISPIQVLKK